MSKKSSINDILHGADDKTIEHIALEYRSVDEKTSRRMYERCVKRMGFSNNYDDTVYAETLSTVPAKRFGVLKACGITAVCAAVLALTIHGLSGMRPDKINNDSEPPVFFTETSVTVTSTTQIETDVTTDITTSIKKAASIKGNDKADTTTTTAIKDGSDKAAVTTADASKSDSSDVQGENGNAVNSNSRTPSAEQPAKKQRPDMDQIADAAVKCRSYNELADAVRNAFGSADYASADGTVSEYWLNDEGSDKLTVDDNAQTVLRDNGRRRYYLIGAPYAPGYDKAEIKTKLINRGILYINEKILLSNIPKNCNGTYGYELFEGWAMEQLESYRFLLDSLMIDSQSDLDLIYEFNGMRCPMSEKKLSGEVPISSHKLTYDEAAEIIHKCNTPEEVIRKAGKLQPYADFAYQGENMNDIQLIYDLDISSADLDDDIHISQLVVYQVYISENHTEAYAVISGNELAQCIDHNILSNINYDMEGIAQAMNEASGGIIKY